MSAILTTLPITTAVTSQVTPALIKRDFAPESLVIQANFTYGSGGTSADAWVQTSLDGGTTWTDIANFHFTTASARWLPGFVNSTWEMSASDCWRKSTHFKSATGG